MPDLISNDTHVFGLACWRARAYRMPRSHRHDDIEVNLVLEGRLDYLCGGRRVTVEAGETCIFWAALPHQVVGTEEPSSAYWLTIPLDTVLGWRLSAQKITRLLSGTLMLAQSVDSAAESELRFARWSDDLASAEAELADIALLEMNAYLNRSLRVAHPTADAAQSGSGDPPRSHVRAAAMASFLATRFADPVSVDDVASAVHLHPHYAMQVFRDALGITIGGYLTLCRLAEAQRLLITTELTVASIAHAAGFGSSSGLYAACAAAGLPPPATYRRIYSSRGRTVGIPASR